MKVTRKHPGGRPPGITMPCGWCGEPQTAAQMRKHFSACQQRLTPMNVVLRLTQSEARVIASMIGIAEAGDGEGAYASWSTFEWDALNTLRAKLANSSAYPSRAEHQDSRYQGQG